MSGGIDHGLLDRQKQLCVNSRQFLFPVLELFPWVQLQIFCPQYHQELGDGGGLQEVMSSHRDITSDHKRCLFNLVQTFEYIRKHLDYKFD